MASWHGLIPRTQKALSCSLIPSCLSFPSCLAISIFSLSSVQTLLYLLLLCYMLYSVLFIMRIYHCCHLVDKSCLTLWLHGLLAHQTPVSMGFFSAKNTGVGCHSLLQGNLNDPGIELASPALQADSLPLSHWKSWCQYIIFWLIYTFIQ